MTPTKTTKTCPRCKGRGYVDASAGRFDGNCLSCGGRGVVLLPFAVRDAGIVAAEKHMGELVARGTAEAARKVEGGWQWTTADDVALNTTRSAYRAARASLAALRALPDSCTVAQVQAVLRGAM
jgi:hypothetical protein